MQKIRYYYSAMSKQVFMLILGFLIVMRFVLLVQVVIYNINDYAVKINIGGSLILYLCYLFICIFFFTAYKFFYILFDDNTVTYYNKLLRKEITINLNMVERAHLARKGIYLYEGKQTSPSFYLPFFRFGIISAVGVDNFYRLLKQKNIKIKKDFVTLLGQGKRWKWVSIMYTCLALLALAPATQTLALVAAIFRSH